MRSDKVSNGVIGPATAQGQHDEAKRGKVPGPICHSFVIRRNLHQWFAFSCY
jgi:hypothetical protein